MIRISIASHLNISALVSNLSTCCVTALPCFRSACLCLRLRIQPYLPSYEKRGGFSAGRCSACRLECHVPASGVFWQFIISLSVRDDRTVTPLIPRSRHRQVRSYLGTGSFQAPVMWCWPQPCRYIALGWFRLSIFAKVLQAPPIEG